MQKFKCKKCSKMVKLIGEPPKEQVCPHCGTEYEWIYDYNRGYKYEVKGSLTRKCLYCNKNIFVKKESGETQKLEKIKCDNCGEYNLVHWLYQECELIPNGKVITGCEWCHENIVVDISKMIQKMKKTIKSGDRAIEFQETIIECEHCKELNEIKIYLGTDCKPNIYSSRVPKTDETKKVMKNDVEKFIQNNIIYQTYHLIHPYSIYDFCELNYFDEDEVFEMIEGMQIEIFEPLDTKTMEVAKYENQFSKLKLKESAMTEAGGASLSGLLGHTKPWKDLREVVLKNNDYTCEICGYQVEPENARRLHVHEEWETEGNVVTLKNVSLICSRCHACKHRNQFVAFRVKDGASELVDGIPRIDLITIHLMKVNHVEKEVIYAYRRYLSKILEEANRKREEDIRKGKIKLDEVYKYQIGDNIPNRDAIAKRLEEKGLLFHG